MVLKDKDTAAEGMDATKMGENGSNSQGAFRLAAWVYSKTKNPAFAKLAISSWPIAWAENIPRIALMFPMC